MGVGLDEGLVEDGGAAGGEGRVSGDEDLDQAQEGEHGGEVAVDLGGEVLELDDVGIVFGGEELRVGLEAEKRRR